MPKVYPFRIVPANSEGLYYLERHVPEIGTWERLSPLSTSKGQAIKSVQHLLSQPLYYDPEQDAFVKVE